MPLTQKEKNAGKALFRKLCGPSPMGSYFSGGLFEEKLKFYKNDVMGDAVTFEDRKLRRIKKVIDSLSEKELNDVTALTLFARQQANPRADNGYRSYPAQYLEAWIASPKVRIETVNSVFVNLANSFKTFEEALPAFRIYGMFLEQSVCANNPWTIQRSAKPGYQVIPYFEAAEQLNGIMPPHTKDQYAYRSIVRKIRQCKKDFFSPGMRQVSCILDEYIRLCPPSRVHD